MMRIKNTYSPRQIRFLRVVTHLPWHVKLYSLSMHGKEADKALVDEVLQNLDTWLVRAHDYQLDTYKVATLIINECREGCFAVIQWWIDENMLQNFVYLKRKSEARFQLFSHHGIATCVWEMAIWWHERNAWVKHVLSKNESPDIAAYLQDTIDTNI